MAYIGSAPSSVVSRQSSRVYRYEATAGQTVFQGADLDNQVLNVTPSDVEIHMNGLLLDPTDYTVTSTSVTLSTPATAGDELTVTGMQTFEVADTYSKTTADARYVNVSGDTMTGGLSVGGYLGLNTQSPINALHIVGNGNDQNDRRILIEDYEVGTNAGLHFKLRSANNTERRGGYYFQPEDGNSDSYLALSANNNDAHLKVDAAGRVAMPYQPAFLARAAPAATYGTAWQKIAYDTLLDQRGSSYSTSTSRFTAPVSGWYAFFASLNSNVNSDGDGAFGIKINGSTNNNIIDVMQAQNGGSYNGRAVSGCKYLSANDYVEVYRYSTVSTTTRHSPWCGNFGGYLIG